MDNHFETGTTSIHTSDMAGITNPPADSGFAGVNEEMTALGEKLEKAMDDVVAFAKANPVLTVAGATVAAALTVLVLTARSRSGSRRGSLEAELRRIMANQSTHAAEAASAIMSYIDEVAKSDTIAIKPFITRAEGIVRSLIERGAAAFR